MWRIRLDITFIFKYLNPHKLNSLSFITLLTHPSWIGVLTQSIIVSDDLTTEPYSHIHTPTFWTRARSFSRCHFWQICSGSDDWNRTLSKFTRMLMPIICKKLPNQSIKCLFLALKSKNVSFDAWTEMSTRDYVERSFTYFEIKKIGRNPEWNVQFS